MMGRLTRKKIIGILLTVAIISCVLIALSYNFFLGTDYRKNRSLEDIDAAAAAEELESNPDARNYILIYDQSDELSMELKDNIERVLDILKLSAKTADITEDVAIGNQDYVIATFREWNEHIGAVQHILAAVEQGASLLAANLPYDDKYINANKKYFGIDEFGEPQIIGGMTIKEDFMLGMREDETIEALAIEDFCYDIKISQSSKLYLESEGGIPIYFTKEYGEGTIGFFNGENLTERYLDGLIIALLGTLEGDFIYPIVNTGVMFIDDWPGPIKGYSKKIDKQYGMTIDEFIRYVWWPDIISISQKYGLRFIGQYVLTYNDNVSEPFAMDDAVFGVEMYSFSRQILKYYGEFGLHGYNHQPLYFSDYPADSTLGYTSWSDKQDAIEALEYTKDQFAAYFPDYKINCYVPPSNIIDETGIEAVKEVLGTPVIISGLYVGSPPLVPEFDVEVEDGVIYFPRFSTGSFLEDGEKLNIVMGMSTYGIFSHFIHPDDVLSEKRSQGYSWEKMRLEIVKIMDFMKERYPFLEYSNATDSANKLIDWYYSDYSIEYNEYDIKISCASDCDKHAMMLYTDKQIIESDEYTAIECGSSTYYIEFEGSEATLKLGKRH